MPENESHNIYPWQFYSGARAVAPGNDISWQDYSYMHTYEHKQSGERRLPTPVWALNDLFLARLLVLFMETRLGIYDPKGSLIERRERARELAIADQPRHAAKLDELNRCYVDETKAGATPERLARLEIEIENLDTYIRTMKNGGMDLVCAVVYMYHRCKFDSVGVGIQLSIKPPHARQILWRMYQVWKQRFNEDGSLKPYTRTHGGPRINWDLEKAIELRKAGFSFKETARRLGTSRSNIYYYFRAHGLHIAKPSVDKPSAPVPAPRPYKWSIPEAILLRMFGCTHREIGEKLGVSRLTVSFAFKKLGVEIERGRPVKPPKERKPPQRKFDWAKAAELRKQGMSLREIATQLGTSHQAARYACEQQGVFVLVRQKAETTKEKHARRKAAGLCLYHEDRKVAPYVLCKECRDKYAAYMRKGRGTPRQFLHGRREYFIDTKRAAELRATGMKWKKIATELGVPDESCMLRAMQRAGLWEPTWKKKKAEQMPGPVSQPELCAA